MSNFVDPNKSEPMFTVRVTFSIDHPSTLLLLPQFYRQLFGTKGKQKEGMFNKEAIISYAKQLGHHFEDMRL